jgi:hypothetical protein
MRYLCFGVRMYEATQRVPNNDRFARCFEGDGQRTAWAVLPSHTAVISRAPLFMTDLWTTPKIPC